MEFTPLYFKDKLNIVNPRGYVGVVTLWSGVPYIRQKFEEAGIDLDPATSPVAVFGNLYGNGLKHLLRNLLYNPQLRYLVICGRDMSGSRQELINFFSLGVEAYQSLGVRCQRVKGTSRTIDILLKPDLFANPPELVPVGELRSPESLELLKEFFGSLPKAADAAAEVLACERIELELPPVEVGRFPSNPRGHVIVRDTPLEAWRELIFRLVRFGHLVHLKKGDRQELQNVKVVVEQPREESAEELARYGFDCVRFKEYQRDIISAEPPAGDTSYKYGHRIRGYFGVDGLQEVAQRLSRDDQDRHCYISLWDSRRDLTASQGRPCLVSLFFRVFEERLTLTATFRTHNAVDAWLENLYGLMAIRGYVSENTGLEPGAITVFSHSISIDVQEYDRAKMVAGEKGFQLNFDPHGNFRITVEDGEIVVRHLFGDMVINEYRGKKAERLQHELNRDCAISDVNHAMYIGRQLARAEICLARGEEFIEA